MRKIFASVAVPIAAAAIVGGVADRGVSGHQGAGSSLHDP